MDAARQKMVNDAIAKADDAFERGCKVFAEMLRTKDVVEAKRLGALQSQIRLEHSQAMRDFEVAVGAAQIH